MSIALSPPVPVSVPVSVSDAALDAAFAAAGDASLEAARSARSFDHLPDLEAEYGFTPLSIEGVLPEGLEGTLFRAGPARATLFGVRVPHPFEADGGMLAVRLSGGRAEGAHRLVRSRGLQEELAAGRRLYGSTLFWPTRLLQALQGKAKNVANTSPFLAGGRLFALMEAGRPTELDPATLDTIGETDLGGALGPTFSAHPHRVAARKTSYNFGVRYGRKHLLDLYAVDDDGRTRVLGAVPLPAPVMLHDFCATRQHLVFFVSPAVIQMGRALLRWGSFDSWVRFEPRRGTEVIVVDIDDISRVRRFSVDVFFQWHFANAYDDGEDLVVDLVRYPGLGTLGAIGKDPDRPELAAVEGGVLVRHRVRARREQLVVEDLGGLRGEFPRCDPRVEGERHGVVFLATEGRTEDPPTNGITRVDVDTGAITRADLARHELPSEPVFVPRAPGAPEGDGHVLALVTDVKARKSAIHVWDAQHLGDGPRARVHLPHASPQTFHGAFLPRER
ncbi:carotenoid oxygenase [Sorangium cellulosum]|uniref:Carotenoid oxygenase n=1 Tax=Sorangium cellulosum TaxID=56 RepID=A0A2L0EK80_SORCE|nr:carotenoid oxygenase family protein [Sorangium cellulosum]AUX39701.1 carotenoid oxygenase [Sorangium cellulosum]